MTMKMSEVAGAFSGTGRGRIKPVNCPDGTKPIAVTREQAIKLIELEADQSGVHSRDGSTVWVLVTHYKEHGIPFRVERLTSPDGVAIVGYEVIAGTHANSKRRLNPTP